LTGDGSASAGMPGGNLSSNVPVNVSPLACSIPTSGSPDARDVDEHRDPLVEHFLAFLEQDMHRGAIAS